MYFDAIMKYMNLYNIKRNKLFKNIYKMIYYFKYIKPMIVFETDILSYKYIKPLYNLVNLFGTIKYNKGQISSINNRLIIENIIIYNKITINLYDYDKEIELIIDKDDSTRIITNIIHRTFDEAIKDELNICNKIIQYCIKHVCRIIFLRRG